MSLYLSESARANNAVAVELYFFTEHIAWEKLLNFHFYQLIFFSNRHIIPQSSIFLFTVYNIINYFYSHNARQICCSLIFILVGSYIFW